MAADNPFQSEIDVANASKAAADAQKAMFDAQKAQADAELAALKAKITVPDSGNTGTADASAAGSGGAVPPAAAAGSQAKLGCDLCAVNRRKRFSREFRRKR